jgi:hypothetical protein
LPRPTSIFPAAEWVGIDGSYHFTGEMKVPPGLIRGLRNSPAASLLGLKGKEGEAVLPIRLAGNPQGMRLALNEELLKKKATEQLTQRLEKGKEGLVKKFLKR